MRVLSKGFETKRRMVQLAYEKLSREKADKLSARNLAKLGGFSPAALYRYFDSMENLIAVASIKFMKEYINDYGKLMDSDYGFPEVYIEGWKLFNSYAFVDPDIYYGLFWGEYQGSYCNAMEEYYELFPVAGSKKYPARFLTLFSSGDIYERDLQVLRLACDKNLMSEADAVYLSRSNPLIVKGIILEALNNKERKQAEKEANQLLRQNLELILQRNNLNKFDE
ncbi:MAG: TetR/AcrR family transcriptional regulator [Candidatus Adiutrix sp.]|nr:TetR/AcrR family transcriptional regulator [Candidatus Adiutrix sp.]